MKKIVSVSLTAVLAVCMMIALTGCGGGEPYEDYDLTEYIILMKWRNRRYSSKTRI